MTLYGLLAAAFGSLGFVVALRPDGAGATAFLAAWLTAPHAALALLLRALWRRGKPLLAWCVTAILVAVAGIAILADAIVWHPDAQSAIGVVWRRYSRALLLSWRRRWRGGWPGARAAKRIGRIPRPPWFPGGQSFERRSMEATVGAAIGGVMGILIAALVGLIIGAVAKFLMPGPDPGGWFVTILLGIAGSWVGGLVFGLLGLQGMATGLIGAVLGAMLLLLIYRKLKSK